MVKPVRVITTLTANALAVFGAANVTGLFSTGYPAGTSGRVTQDSDIGIADLLVAAPGATGTKSFSLSGASQNVGISLALAEAGAAAASFLVPPPRMPMALLAR